MKWIAAILLIVWLEWVLPVPDEVSWQFALGAKYLTVALLFQAWLSYIGKESLLLRSAVALLCLDSWASVAAYVLWNGTGVDLMLLVFLVFTFWLFFILKREYHIENDKLNKNTVALLLLRPKSVSDIVRAFIGIPVSSLCIVADGYVFSFRHKTGRFERSRLNPILLKRHIVVDTGVSCNPSILNELDIVVGTNRFPSFKCIYAVRHVLNRLGGIYRIQSWADYLPGIYASRILTRKGSGDGRK